MSAKDRRQKAKKLGRRTETREVKSTFRIYAEGEATEPEYIDIIKRIPAIANSVSIAIRIEEVGATPKRLVESACSDKRRSDLDIDHFWCVFDVENPEPHPYLKETLQKARDNNISLAISNPCFEVWLILHHKHFSKHVSTKEAVDIRKSLDETKTKHLDPQVYRPLISLAVQRAEQLNQKHKKDGTTFPENNPSSTFCDLVSSLTKMAKNAS